MTPAAFFIVGMIVGYILGIMWSELPTGRGGR